MGILKALVFVLGYFIGLVFALQIDPYETKELVFVTLPWGMLKEFTVGYLIAGLTGLVPWGA